MVKRRTILLGTAGAVGALVVGWSVAPPRQRLTTSNPLATKAGESALNGWVKIDADNRVTIMMSKSEMGQGVHTGLAMLLAEELDADWAQVRLEHSPIDKIYNNIASVADGLPYHPDNDSTLKHLTQWMIAKLMREIGVMMTGGSSSMKDLWLPMREAGASARAMLVAAAAQQWKVAAAECAVQGGRVSHPSGKSASFGELASAASQISRPGHVTLKTPSQFKLVGRNKNRIEAASKLDGSAKFGLDVVLPDMLYASVVMCPTLGGTVTRFDGSKASQLPGVKKVLRVEAFNGSTPGVAVVATSPYHALKALKLLDVTWDHGPNAKLNSADVLKQLSNTLESEQGHAFYKKGDVDAALKTAAQTLQAEYSAPFLAHATMEPMNCTVQVNKDSASVWVSTQVPGLARRAVAKVLGLDEEQVEVQVQLLGGGFGRRLDVDYVAQAAAIAREMEGVPVQTFWSREQDMTHDFYRPASVARFTAGLDLDRQLVAWKNTSAGQALVPHAMKRVLDLPSSGPDKTTSEGAFDQPYEWPTARIGHAIVEAPVPVGFWRSVGHSQQAFFKESFLDEVAFAAKKDPVAMRTGLLAKHPRHLKVLQRVADMSSWGQPRAAGPDGSPRALGVALHQSFGSVVAQVAEVSVSADKQIRVHKVWCVVDCGTPINPNMIRQQMESAIVFGLSAALYGEITLVDGQVQQSNFHNYPMLRITDCPVVETDIIASNAAPEGVGEPGTPPIAPAVANALFTLTGERLRALPLKLS